MRNTSPEERTGASSTGLGPDPIGEQQEGEISSSQETFTPPSPAKAKAKGKAKAGPKQPGYPPPNWVPSLRLAGNDREGAAPGW